MPSYAVSPPQQRMSIVDTLQRTATPGSSIFYSREAERVYRSRSSSQFHTNSIFVDGLIGEVDRLSSLCRDWNSYGSAAPSQASIATAKHILESLASEALTPEAVRPSAEGGVAIIFSGASRNRAIIESLNDEEQFILLYDVDGNSQTIDWTRNDETVLLSALRQHLKGVPLATATR